MQIPGKDEVLKALAGMEIPLAVVEEVCPSCAEKMKELGISAIKISEERQIPEPLLQGLCDMIDGSFTTCMETSFGEFEAEIADNKEGFCAWLVHECTGEWPGARSAEGDESKDTDASDDTDAQDDPDMRKALSRLEKKIDELITLLHERTETRELESLVESMRGLPRLETDQD